MNQILYTAAYQFMELGYDKVSLDGVAKACGVTKASVYYYFDNKAKLFTESILFVLKIAYDQTYRILLGPGSLQERMLNVAERHMHNEHIDFETMMREASLSLTQEQVDAIRNGEHALHELLAGQFQKAIDKGEITPCDPLLLSHMFTAILTVRNRKEILNEQKTVKQVAEEIMQLIWNGLANRS